MIKLTSAESAKRIPSAMVTWKSVRSKPRRVWKPDEKLPAPNAPPIDAPVRCKRIAAMRRSERTIWIYGSICWSKTILGTLARARETIKKILPNHRTPVKLTEKAVFIYISAVAAYAALPTYKPSIFFAYEKRNKRFGCTDATSRRQGFGATGRGNEENSIRHPYSRCRKTGKGNPRSRTRRRTGQNERRRQSAPDVAQGRAESVLQSGAGERNRGRR